MGACLWAMFPGVGLPQQLRGHLQIVKGVTGGEGGLPAELLEDGKVGAGLHQKEALVLRHAPRLQTVLLSSDQPGGSFDASWRACSSCSLLTSATKRRKAAPSTSSPKSIASTGHTPSTRWPFSSRK